MTNASLACLMKPATRTDLGIKSFILTSCRNHVFSSFSFSLVPPKFLCLQSLSNVDELTLTVDRQGLGVPYTGNSSTMTPARPC